MAGGLVTGHTGSEHISGQNWGALNAGILGNDSYLLQTGSKMAATMVSANKVRVLDGDAVVNGRHYTIDCGTHEELAVENGTQGQKRNDLVVLRYECASATKVEAMRLKYIKGTPTTGTPADPAYASGKNILKGDLVVEVPLYRLALDGLTVAAPVLLLPELPSAKVAWDSICRDLSHDTGWVKQWYVAGKIDVRARRIGHTVTVRGESYGGWVVPNGRYDGMTTIQTDMRPSIDIPFDFHASGGAKSGAAAHVGTDGVIEMYCTTDGLSYWGFSVTYLV